MRIGGLFFAGLAAFFAIVTATYWIFSHEAAGTTALALTVGLCVLVSFYLLFTGRRLPDLPEDRPTAEIDEGAGELGFFSPSSWWPLWLAGSLALVFLGLVFGWWLFGIGLVLTGASAIGFVFEYYRGARP